MSIFKELLFNVLLGRVTHVYDVEAFPFGGCLSLLRGKIK
jgi:hypothetical protein